jgi:nitrate reductase beta subunit
VATPGTGSSPSDYGGPWELNYEEVAFGGAAGRARLAPREPQGWGPNWDEDIGAGDYPNAYYFYLPRMCNHCDRPACAEACPRNAIAKRAEDGVVVLDPAVCEGCPDPVCLRACPYKEVYPAPARGLTYKCHACLPRLEDGVAPACVRMCPGRAVWVGLLGDGDSPVQRLVETWRVALPLHPEFHTGPNVYYVPPLSPPPLGPDGRLLEGQERIPREYLRSLFGPGLDASLDTLRAEMEKQRAGERSELMDILIARRWTEMLGPYGGDPGEVA